MADDRLASDQKKADKEGRTLVFVDESGFFLRPCAGKTWSPAGKTPEIKAPLSHDHLSVIGALTWRGGLFLQVHRSSVNAERVIEFVRHLLRHLPGPLWLLWDRARIHRSRALHEFRQLDTIGRLKIDYFPPYAPEVDPQEYVWRLLKHVDLRNVTSYSLDQLWARLQDASIRLRQRVKMLKNLSRHAGLKS